MAVYFCDSSAIVKRYVREVGTDWVLGIADPVAGHRIYVAGVTAVEVVAALVRRRRAGHLSATDAAAAIGRFRHDLANQYRVVGITIPLIERAMNVAERHALRGYDALQLAAALEVRAHQLALGMAPLTIVSADGELNAAAGAEGLDIEDPNTHP